MGLLGLALFGCGGTGGGGVGNGNGLTTADSSALDRSRSGPGTSDPAVPGIVPRNQVMYDEFVDGTYLLRTIDPTGVGDAPYAVIPEEITALCPDPRDPKTWYFAASAATGAHVFYARRLAVSGAEDLTPKAELKEIRSLQVAENGRFAAFIGQPKEGEAKLFLLPLRTKGAVPLAIATATAFHVSPKSDRIVFTNGKLSVQAISGVKLNGKIRPLGAKTAEQRFPQFNRDGSRIVFSGRESEKEKFDLYAISPDGQNEVRLTRTPEDDERGATFSATGDDLIYVNPGTDETVAGLYRMAVKTPAERIRIKPSLNIGEARWTGNDGRLRGTANVGLVLRPRPKADKPKPETPVPEKPSVDKPGK